jgi:DHA1 family chloramphenicol resistance protein-like MFS transporter
MGGSYATAALNLGAVCGPALAALSLTYGTLGPVWVAAVMSGLAVLTALPARHLVIGPTAGSPGGR